MSRIRKCAKIGMPFDVICEKCGERFSYKYNGGYPRKLCPDCGGSHEGYLPELTEIIREKYRGR